MKAMAVSDTKTRVSCQVHIYGAFAGRSYHPFAGKKPLCFARVAEAAPGAYRRAEHPNPAIGLELELHKVGFEADCHGQPCVGLHAHHLNPDIYKHFLHT